MPTIYSKNKITGEFERVGLGAINIPTKTSDLTNDSGFVNEGFVNNAISKIPTPDVSGQISAHNTSKDAHGDIRNAIPTKTSELTNDSGFITGYTETDPTVPAWAKTPSKPTYTASEVGALPLSGGMMTGELGVNGKMTQGSPSSDSSLASMNRFETDIFVEGNGSAPNNPTAPGFYLGKSASDGNRHLDIVSGDSFSYIDFNKGGRGADYDVRLLVNVENGETQFMWGDNAALTNRKFSVQGEIYQWGSPVALRSEIPTLSTETWTFTLEDGSTVTKAVYVG